MKFLARNLAALTLCALIGSGPVGCTSKKPALYGREAPTYLPGMVRQVWAVAPAVDLSGQPQVDPILQADLLYLQLQQVQGLTVIPVNRVIEVFATLRLDRIQSEAQAALVCDLLDADAILIPTVTAYDPYNPPKLGASLQLFRKPGAYSRPTNIDPYELSRAATPGPADGITPISGAVQAVGIYDAANGSVREKLESYAAGRNEPGGPMGPREYMMSMDRYVGFVYHDLIRELLSSPRMVGP